LGQELADERSQRAVISEYEIEYFFGLHSFSEGVVAAEIAEHDDGLAAILSRIFSSPCETKPLVRVSAKVRNPPRACEKTIAADHWAIYCPCR
jgi:hypothetical protein